MKALTYGIVAACTLLAACSDNDDMTPTPPEVSTQSYTVTITNLTKAQPFSPVLSVLHAEQQLWQIGESASTALEKLAESGDTSELAALPFVMHANQGENLVLSGDSKTYSVTLMSDAALKLSVITMLVNTNDAFTGLNGVSVSELAIGDSLSFMAPAYDAGTEANSEVAGTIPGPADGGEGFNSTRDDTNFVSMHAGVVSQQDGLATSVLMADHKFDNPVAHISITRDK